MSAIFLKPGERGVLVGRSGTGKTAGAVYQLRHTAISPVIVFDTKGEPKFDGLPREIAGEREKLIEVTSLAQFAALDYDAMPEYVIVRPAPVEIADAEALDKYLMTVYDKFAPCLVYIDEAYQFNIRGQAGPGLVGLLTRGRSENITTLIGSQRPAWVTRFAFSEAVRYYAYELSDERDRRRLGEFIPGFEELPKLEEFYFYYYHVRDDAAQLMAPVPLQKPLPAAAPGAPGAAPGAPGAAPAADNKPGRAWL